MTHLPCFQHVCWHPTGAERRSFALAMLIGFLALGALAAWRSHEFGTTTRSLWAIGVSLGLVALLPGVGRIAYLAVYVPSSLVGYVVSHALLTLIFFLLFVPLGLTLRLLGKNLLQLQPQPKSSYWIARPGSRTGASYYRRF